MSQLDLSGNEIRDNGSQKIFQCHGLSRLTHLSLANNKIQSIFGLSNDNRLTAMSTLNLDNNYISS